MFAIILEFINLVLSARSKVEKSITMVEQNVELIWAEIALIESSLGKIYKSDRIETIVANVLTIKPS